MIQQAVAVELRAFKAAGRTVVVRNGYLLARELQTDIGPVSIQIPKVRTRTVAFLSTLVPPCARKTRSPETAPLWLYLIMGMISTGEMVAALDEVCVQTSQQRRWMHRAMNIPNYPPKSLQAKAKQVLHAIWQAYTRENAEQALSR